MNTRLILFSFFACISLVNAQVCFSPKTSYLAGINSSSLCHADFNGDGKTDIAVANKSGTVSILLGNGSGGLGTALDFPVGFLSNSVCADDFNGDHIPDLATTNMGPWNVSVIFGNGSGGFGTDSLFGANTPYTIASADFNRDGKADLAVGIQGRVLIALGDGAGNFGTATGFGVGHSYTSITTADLNGDTIIDLAMTGSSNMVWILLGNGTGGFGSASGFPAGNTPSSVVSADFNGDGKIDLATANRFSNDVSILLGSGTGSFAPATNFDAGSGPVSLISEDFNGDGKMDLAVADAGADSVFILAGNGIGGFLVAGTFAVDSFPNSITSADFNGDGKMDLALSTVYTNLDTGKVDILLNCSVSATGINPSFATSNRFAIYPNPNEGIFTLEMTTAQETWEKLELYNMLGERVYSASNLSLQTSVKMNLSKEPAGIYFAKIYAGGKIQNEKIVIQR